MKRKRTPLGYSSLYTGTTVDPLSAIASNWTLRHKHTALALKPLQWLPFWLKTLRKSSWDPPLTIFEPLAVKTLLNSHHAQHFSANSPKEVLLLTGPHITLLHNNLNPDPLLPSIFNADRQPPDYSWWFAGNSFWHHWLPWHHRFTDSSF